MSLVSFKYSVVPKYLSTEDIRSEMQSIQSLCTKHDLLCRAFADWRMSVEQNNAQLDILTEAAGSLRRRHKVLTDLIALRPKDPSILCRLERDIGVMERQVAIWIRELGEVNDHRARIDNSHAVEFVCSDNRLQRSLTNIALAHSDLETLDERHERMWKQFLVTEEGQPTAGGGGGEKKQMSTSTTDYTPNSAYNHRSLINDAKKKFLAVQS